MTSFKIFFIQFICTVLLISVSFSFVFMQSCKNDKKQGLAITAERENVIEIVTENMDFQMPDTISSGWDTFRYINNSPQTHFFLIEKYPEGKRLGDAKNKVVPYFESGMKFINEGDGKKAIAEFGKLPKWYGDVQFLGGSGLVSAGRTSVTAVKLNPGYYILECYVKMKNGVFHSAMGMIDEFVVSNTISNTEELKADSYIDISSNEGITFKDSLSSRKHTFSVTFKDQVKHENFVGHDINLVKLNENANLETLEGWMNWTSVTNFKFL